MGSEVISSEGDFSELDFGDLLKAIQRGGARYPESWDRVVTFSSRKSPQDIDAAKFGEFQRALLDRAGIRLRLVGAKYGCTDAFFEVSVPDPSKAERTYGIRTNITDPSEIRAMLTEVLRHDAHLRSLAVAAGLPTLRGNVNLDLTSNNVSEGTPPEMTFQVQKTSNTFNAPVGVVSDKASTKSVAVNPGTKRRSGSSSQATAQEESDKPYPE